MKKKLKKLIKKLKRFGKKKKAKRVATVSDGGEWYGQESGAFGWQGCQPHAH